MVQRNFELRKVELGICTRDFGTPCVHEHACIRCPALRPDPAQEGRLREILTNLGARLAEAREQGWLGEVAGLEVSLAAAEQKLTAMRQLADRHRVTHLGMPDYRSAVGRANAGVAETAACTAPTTAAAGENGQPPVRQGSQP